MNIPSAAVDAAAAAIIVTEGRTENIRALASRIVSAAAPFIAAQSLRDAADYLDTNTGPNAIGIKKAAATIRHIALIEFDS